MLEQLPELKNKPSQAKEIKSPSENVANAIRKQKEFQLKQMTLEEVQAKYSNRYTQFLKLVDNEEINENDLKKWINNVENLEDYVINHYENGGVLRERQVGVFEDLLYFIEEGKKHGKIVLPTGVGKTILFLEIVKALNLPTLIVVPTQILVEQTGDKIDQFSPDAEYGKIYAKAKQTGKQITIITYDSFTLGIKTGKIKPEDYGLFVLDEAHESLSKLRRNSVEQCLPHGLTLELTATDAYSENKKLTSETIHEMTILEAVEEGLLTPFSCIVAKANVDLSSVKINNDGEYNSDQLGKELEKAGINKACVELYEKGFKDQSAIVFVNSVNRANTVKKDFENEFGQGYAEVLVGETSLEERKQILEDYKNGKIKVLIGVNILTRGFDEPKASVCINLDPTQSIVNASQKGGRVLRLDPGNADKHAHIIDFVYNDKRSKAQPVLYSEIAGQSFIMPSSKQQKESILDEIKETQEQKEKNDILSQLDISRLQVIVNHNEVMRVTQEGVETRNKIRTKEKVSFEEMKSIVREAGIQTSKEYTLKYSELGLPSSGTLINRSYWTDWDDFLGREKLSFEDMKNIARKAGIKSSDQYALKYKDLRLPAPLTLSNRTEWLGWDDFLGREVRENLSLIQIQNIIKVNKIKTYSQYRAEYKSLKIPSADMLEKMENWISWDDFLGKEKITFYQIQEICRNAKMQTYGDYHSSYKELGLPSTSALTNSPQWPGWQEFLAVESKEKMSFNQILAIARNGKIVDSADYHKKAKELGLPSLTVVKKYDEWNGIDDLLGKDDWKKLSFGEVRQRARNSGIRSSKIYGMEYKNFGLPANSTLKTMPEWKGWDDFLGRN